MPERIACQKQLRTSLGTENYCAMLLGHEGDCKVLSAVITEIQYQLHHRGIHDKYPSWIAHKYVQYMKGRI